MKGGEEKMSREVDEGTRSGLRDGRVTEAESESQKLSHRS